MSQTPQTMRLSELLADYVDVPVGAERAVRGLTLDSREVCAGTAFLACGGTRIHGMAFIEDAVRRGAAAILMEPPGEQPGRVDYIQTEDYEIPVIPVPNLARRAGVIAARFYGHPSRELTVIGVTGTNGKTSVSQFVAQALAVDGPVGLIGTLGSGLWGELTTTGHTTPDAVRVQEALFRFTRAGARAAVMEVSSHGLHQGRVEGVEFDVAVFTNLSHDHLDYHGDLASYAEVKRRLFDVPGLKVAVINSDDATGRTWLGAFSPSLRVISFGLSDNPDRPVLWARSVEPTIRGLKLIVQHPTGEVSLTSELMGRFNASNLLAAFGSLLAIGLEAEDAAHRLERVKPVSGRMERFGSAGQPMVVVDYAHTPDALEQALLALREHTAGKLVCVFGCGGDRDREKRPHMGKVAQKLADIVILTDDNPRSEEPRQIIGEIQQGMDKGEQIFVEHDRYAAIAKAIQTAREGDAVLVAGKGHETEQQIGDRKLHFSDREVVEALLREARHG